MKKNRIKITAILLFLLQLALGVKSFLVVRKMEINNIDITDRLLLFTGFLAGVLISTVLIIIIFGSLSKAEGGAGLDGDNKMKEKKRKAKRKSQKENIDDSGLEQQQAIEKLSFELTGINELEKFTEKILINISKVYDIMQGIFFVKDQADKVFRKTGTYAYYSEDELREFAEEVGLSGQVASNKKLLNISNIPEKYITVLSGLGKSSPANLLILPVIYNNESIGIIELASFKKFDSIAEKILAEFTNEISEKLFELSGSKELAKD